MDADIFVPSNIYSRFLKIVHNDEWTLIYTS